MLVIIHLSIVALQYHWTIFHILLNTLLLISIRSLYQAHKYYQITLEYKANHIKQTKVTNYYIDSTNLTN